MSDDETLREELEKLRQGWSAAKLFAFAEQLVEMLERPRPAPPEHLAALLCETAPSEEGHSWCLTARPQGPCTAHRSQAARLTGRVFVGSAGTGAAPPSEALTRSRIDHWLRILEIIERACVWGTPRGNETVTLSIVELIMVWFSGVMFGIWLGIQEERRKS
jgi:hypothetical protein